MASFKELDWGRIDVKAIVAGNGLATIDSRRRIMCRDWLQRQGYEIKSLDCGNGVNQLIAELGCMLEWERQFGYTLTPDNCNLNALRDGFEFDVPSDGGVVLELVDPESAWKEDADWFQGLLSIASERSLFELALGKRFFTLLVLADESPLIGQSVTTIMVPSPFWNPCRDLHEFEE